MLYCDYDVFLNYFATIVIFGINIEINARNIFLRIFQDLFLCHQKAMYNVFHPCRKQMIEKTDTGAGIPGVNPRSTICHDLNLSKLSNFSVLHLFSGYIKEYPHTLTTF